MAKFCRHLASLSMGKLSNYLKEATAVPLNFCSSCSSESSETFACLSCFETFCTCSVASSTKKGPNHMLTHSRTPNHSIFFKISSLNNTNNSSNPLACDTSSEVDFFCSLCEGIPKLKEPGKKERITLEKIKKLFLENQNNLIEPITNTNTDDTTTNSSSNGAVPLVPKGLINLGNTCFMNSALQLLAATIKRNSHSLKPPQNSPLWNSLLWYSDEIYSNSSKSRKHSSSSAAVNPRDFLNLLVGKQKKFASMQQQDAHDFLRLLFNSLAPETPHVELFGGKFVSKVTCERCRTVSETFEPFLDISLSISTGDSAADSIHSSLSRLSLTDLSSDNVQSTSTQNIHSLLQDWNKKITLQGDNGYYCENCSPKCNETLQTASLQFFLTPQLPPFLILHLQRFKTHYYASSSSSSAKKSKAASFKVEIQKDDKSIKFPFILNIPSDSIISAIDSVSVKYRLYGYIVHEGSTTSCGHYTAVVSSSDSDDSSKWYYISDTRVKEISKNRALDEDSFEPYLLFYQRIDV